MSSVRHHALTFTLRNIHVHPYAHRLLACSLKCDRNIQSIWGVFTFWVLFLELSQWRLCWKSGHHQTKTSPLDKGYDHDCERKFCTTAEHLYFMLQVYCPTMHISYKAREVSVLMPISWNWPVTSSKWSVAMLVWTTSFEGQKFVSRERLSSRCSWFY